MNSFDGKAGRPRYQLFRTANRFCWRLLAGNGQTLAEKAYQSRRARNSGLVKFRKASATLVTEDYV